MARKVSVWVVANRKALDAIRQGYVDGLEEIGKVLIEQTEPLDDPATPEKIVGDWGVWADGRKVAGTAAKPRAADTKKGLTLLAGFPFPMRFDEIGTIHQPPRPRFSPTLSVVIPGSGRYVSIAVRKATAGI
jgi:hypothetical protein